MDLGPDVVRDQPDDSLAIGGESYTVQLVARRGTGFRGIQERESG